MSNVAILIGNTEYATLDPLHCCEADVRAIKELLDATAKFDDIKLLINAESARLKDCIRTGVDAYDSTSELFFYFTGHGFQHAEEFYFCATNFDAKRPNDTGLSNTELHTLLRASNAELVVKVVDACYSGALLVKGDGSFLPTSKNGFKNLIQIAACLDSQNSLTGEPLSIFTEKFRVAALRKIDGPVYYGDIINVLRDEFLDNNSQTPHFVFQGTGRDVFVESAKRLDGLRAKLSSPDAAAAPNVPSVAEQPANILDILQEAEARFVKKEAAKALISGLFDKLKTKMSSDSFGDIFDTEIVEHSDFEEPTTRAFIIRVLMNEKRPDNFVTAIAPVRNPFAAAFELAAMSTASAIFGSADDALANHKLELNCELEKAQLKITLTPRFMSLRRFVLVVSCAPSLEVCYVMEMLTEHLRVDWDMFDSKGTEVARRWYKVKWTHPGDLVVQMIFDKLRAAVQESVDAAARALSQNSPGAG